MACNSCKSKKPVERVKWTIITVGLFITATAIYGTVQLLKNIMSFFN